MSNDKQSAFKGGLAVVAMLARGFLIPASVGAIGYVVSYPLLNYSCQAYSESIERPHRFRWFSCYIQGTDGRWLSKMEYVMSEVGSKLIIENTSDHPLKELIKK